jgi:phenylalanyl-tRNA synthetase beta chain
VIGMPLTLAQCVDALTRLGLPLTQTSRATGDPDNSGHHHCDAAATVPLRHAIEEDLIEEVARIIGYNNLPVTPPLAPITARIRPESQRSSPACATRWPAWATRRRSISASSRSAGSTELAGNPDPVKLLNPIASQMGVMRSSLLGSLLQVLKFNQDRKAARVRVFEIGRVFLRDASVPDSDTTCPGLPSADARGRDGPRPGRRLPTGVRRIGWSISSTPSGDVEALLGPVKPVLEPPNIPRCIPGAVRGWCWMGR